MPDVKQPLQADHVLLGQIIATVLVGAVDAGVIALNPEGVVTNPAELLGIIQGFVAIWAPRTMSKAEIAARAAMGKLQASRP